MIMRIRSDWRWCWPSGESYPRVFIRDAGRWPWAGTEPKFSKGLDYACDLSWW